MSPSYDLSFDIQVLRDAGTHLTILSSEFGRAGQHAKEVASLVGHDRLAGAIRGFADKWDHHRERLKKAVDALDADVKTIADSFEQTDKALGDAIAGVFDGMTIPSSGNSSGVVSGSSAGAGAPDGGGLMPQFKSMQQSAEQRLAQLEAHLAALRADLAELESQIGTEMQALRIRETIERVEMQRDAVISLINGLLGPASSITSPGSPTLTATISSSTTPSMPLTATLTMTQAKPGK